MSTNKSQITVTSKRPCRHCGKTDWCYYFIDSGLEVCNRGNVAPGWLTSKKQDANGNPYLYEEEAPKAKPKIVKTQRFLYTDREGQPLARVCRHNFDDGSKKPFRQGLKNGRWVNSCKHIPRENIPIYRYVEIQKAIADGLQIFWVEGEKCADILWLLGIPATTNFGGSGQLKESDLLDLEGANLVICPDQDKPGLKLAERVYEYYPHSAWLYANPDSKGWQPEWVLSGNGYDIADWIIEEKLTKKQILDAIEIYRGKLLPDDTQLIAPEAEYHYTEKAIEALYSQGHYIALEDNLYKFNGKFYEKLLPKKEQRKIADWARSNPVPAQGDRWKFSQATPSHISNIWNWLIIRFGVDRTEVDPPGLNLSNGVLQISIKGKKVEWELTPHSPKKLYTHLIDVEYNPKANSNGVEKLLTCLDSPEQEIFLRTLAASLDLKTFRAKTKHTIKALLLHGEGNNGKDSLRAVTSLLFSESMVNSDFQDFKNYDQGNQNSLVSLVNAKICWSSENSQFISLENCQSLKKAITGEPLTVKYLYENPQEINPCSIFLFNCNEPPSLSGGSEAILRRWGILRFNKVFKSNPDARYGELEADQRFRYDDDFLRTEIAPGLLNKILERLPLVIQDGIDYDCVKENIQELQEESNHLWGFVRDFGIVERPGSKLYVKELWSDLKQWYINTGTLEVVEDNYGKTKETWHDQVNPFDKSIKGPNQIYKAFKKMFPKIKKDSEKEDRIRKNQTYLIGLAKTASHSFPRLPVRAVASPFASHWEAVGEAVGEAVTLI